jgi:large subunit ribosomal protein L29
MADLTSKDIRDLSVDQIADKLNDAREELMKLRFQTATGELTDTSRLRTARRQVARLMTILAEAQRVAAAQAE